MIKRIDCEVHLGSRLSDSREGGEAAPCTRPPPVLCDSKKFLALKAARRCALVYETPHPSPSFGVSVHTACALVYERVRCVCPGGCPGDELTHLST